LIIDTCTPSTPSEATEITCNDGLDNDCDGSTDYIDSDCDGNFSIDFSGATNTSRVLVESSSVSNSNFTVEAWVKTTATSYPGTFGTILVKGRAYNENYGLYVHDSGKVRLQFTSGGVQGDASKYALLDSTSTINDGQFHHIYGEYDGLERDYDIKG